MIDVINLKEMPEGVVELGGRVKVLSGQDMTSCIFPEPLDYVEVRRIRGQENEADTEFGGLVLYSLAMLIPRIVENDGDRGTARFPSHFFKKGHRLVGIHIDHGMGVYEVKGKGIHASEKIEAVPSRSGLEVKGLLAPHMAGEGFQREMDGIHKIELALALFRLIYNWLQCGDPFLLFLRTRSARNGLCLYEPQAERCIISLVHVRLNEMPLMSRMMCAASAELRGTSDSSLLEISSMCPFSLLGRPGIGTISRTESIPSLL